MQTRKHDTYGEITPQQISWADDMYYEGDICPECGGYGQLEFSDTNIMDYCPFCFNGTLQEDDALFFNECVHDLKNSEIARLRKQEQDIIKYLESYIQTHKPNYSIYRFAVKMHEHFFGKVRDYRLLYSLLYSSTGRINLTQAENDMQEMLSEK